MIIILLILLLFTWEYPRIFIPIIVLTSGVLFISVKKVNNKILEEEKAIEEAKERFWEKYDEIKSKINIPVETRIVHYKEGDANILNGNLQAWVEDDMLCFFPFVLSLDETIDIDEKINLLKIFIDDIDYITRDGNDGKTILKYYFRDKDYSMIFTSRDYMILKEMFPEKAYPSIKECKVSNIVK
jgi:hypothetical protein